MKTYGLQRETKAYLRRLRAAGRVLDKSAIADVDDFVRGMKEIGVFHNMICWICRAPYNLNNGLTLTSLTGGTNFDATLLSSPLLTDYGLVRQTAGGNLLSTTINTLEAAPVSCGSVIKSDTDLGHNAFLLGTAGINVSGRQFAFFNTGVATTQGVRSYKNAWPPSQASVGGNISDPSLTRTSRHYMCNRIFTGTSGRVSLNSFQNAGSAALVDSWDQSSPKFVRFGAYNVALNLTLSLLFLRNSIITDQQDALFYQLIKRTVCKNLNLP
jgi:hypothetical protein